MKMKNILIILCAVCLAAVWGVRFYYVNSTCEKPQIEIYDSGEMVPVGKNFFLTADDDKDGYEFRVDSASVKTLENFLAENGQPADYFREGNHPAVFVPKYIYDVEVTVRNAYNENTDPEAASVSLVTTVLKSANQLLQVHYELFDMLYPQLGGNYGFKLRPDSEMTFHFPFAAIPMYAEACDLDYFESEQFYLLISMYPVEKLIRVE
jgi:hypothetical protein